MNKPGRFWGSGPSEISSADLMRECGQKLTDRTLWGMFQDRFRTPIFTYLLRGLRYHSKTNDLPELVADLAQDVYVLLLRNSGEKLRGFRGDTHFAALAFLARVCTGVVSDHLRRGAADKRLENNVVSFDEVTRMRDGSRVGRNSVQSDELDVGAILSWIDVERMVASDPDRANAQRNALIFKLHYIDGLTAPEIAGYPGFEMTVKGVEAVLTRTRRRLKK